MNIELCPDDFSYDERSEMLSKATSAQLATVINRSLPEKKAMEIRKELSSVVFEAFTKIYLSSNNDLADIVDWIDSPEVDNELKEVVRNMELFPELYNVQCEGIK